jgi:hypothetical protein
VKAGAAASSSIEMEANIARCSATAAATHGAALLPWCVQLFVAPSAVQQHARMVPPAHGACCPAALTWCCAHPCSAGSCCWQAPASWERKAACCSWRDRLEQRACRPHTASATAAHCACAWGVTSSNAGGGGGGGGGSSVLGVNLDRCSEAPRIGNWGPPVQGMLHTTDT